MKRFKKLVPVVAIILSLTIIVGCGQEQEMKETTSEATEETKQEEKSGGETKSEEKAEVAEEIVLKFYSWESYYEEVNAKVIAEFEAMYPNVSVEATYIADGNSTEYVKKMDIQMLSGEQVDVVMQPGLDKHVDRATKGLLEPLDDYFANEGIIYDDVYAFPVSVDNTTYGLPGDVKSWFVMINKDHLDAAGLDVPPLDWTWEDYRTYAKALSQGEGKDKRYGSYFHTWPQFSYLAFNSEKMNTAFYKEDGNLNFDDPLFSDFLKFRYEMDNVDECQVPYTDAISQKLSYRDIFFTEKASMIPIGGWMIAEVSSDKYPHNFVTTFASLPRFYEDSASGMTDTASHVYCVSKESKHKEAAYNFVRFMTTKGMEIKGVSLSAANNADVEGILSKIIEGNEKYYDVEGLLNVYTNPEWKDNISAYMPAYHSQISDVYNEEAEKYLIGGQDLDISISNMMERAQKIMDEAQ